MSIPEVIISVPHSGTRSLVEQLQLGPAPQRSRWWHFVQHADEIKARQVHAHIPVRDPLDVARSWARRNQTGQPLEQLLEHYARMFAFITSRPHTLHHMESLAKLKGLNEWADVSRNRRRLQRYEMVIREFVVHPRRDFFAPFYPEYAC